MEEKEIFINDIEITCEVYDDLSTIKKELENNNFHFVEEFILDDIYMYNINTGEFAEKNGKIKNTLLIRNVNEKDKEIICKRRIYNSSGFEIGTEKTTLKIDNIEAAENLLNVLGYKRFLRMIDKNYMYENDNYIAYIQEVNKLGLFLEIEFKNSESENDINKLIELVKSLNLKIGTKFDVRKADLLYKKQNNI